MSAGIHVHGPFAFTAEHAEGDGSVFVVCTAPGTRLTFIKPGRAELDDLIRAARQAQDLLGDGTPGGAS